METHFSTLKFSAIDQAGWDNSAQKLKNINNLAVFDHFGIVKYNISGALANMFFHVHIGRVL